jgi:hypothetical protein
MGKLKGIAIGLMLMAGMIVSCGCGSKGAIKKNNRDR